MREIIGTMTLKSANSERARINSEIQRTLRSETGHWGIEIVRTEPKAIDPPRHVQATMNKVVKAENERAAAVDVATAMQTMADGARRAEIRKAEGIKQAKMLEAEGEAQAIKLVNAAADKYSVGDAQLLRRLIAAEVSLSENAKIVVPSNTEMVNVIGEMPGLVRWSKKPIPAVPATKEEARGERRSSTLGPVRGPTMTVRGAARPPHGTEGKPGCMRSWRTKRECPPGQSRPAAKPKRPYGTFVGRQVCSFPAWRQQQPIASSAAAFARTGLSG